MCTKIEFKILELGSIASAITGVIHSEYDSKIKLLVERNSKDQRKYYRLIFLACSLITALYGSARAIIFIFNSNEISGSANAVENYRTFRLLKLVYILFPMFYICICILQLVYTVYWDSLKQLFNQLLTLQKKIGNHKIYILFNSTHNFRLD